MDPNENLKKIRQLVTQHLKRTNSDPKAEGQDLDQLVDLFDSLDIWLSKGGFLPNKWQNEVTQCAM